MTISEKQGVSLNEVVLEEKAVAYFRYGVIYVRFLKDEDLTDMITATKPVLLERIRVLKQLNWSHEMSNLALKVITDFENEYPELKAKSEENLQQD